MGGILEDSPAADRLSDVDVIPGVVSSPVPGAMSAEARFTSDAAVVLSKAIAAAEGSTHGGKLVLNVWREGEVLPVTLNLELLGDYNMSSPRDCE